MLDIRNLTDRLREQPTDEDWWVYGDWLAERGDPWAPVVAAGVGGQRNLTSLLAGPEHGARFGASAHRFLGSEGATMAWTETGPYVSYGRGTETGPPPQPTVFRFLNTSWPSKVPLRRDQLPPALGGLSFWAWDDDALQELHGLDLHALTLSNYRAPGPVDLDAVHEVGPLAALSLYLPVVTLEPLVELPALRRLLLDERAGVSLAPLLRVPGLRHLTLRGPSRMLAAGRNAEQAMYAPVADLVDLESLSLHRASRLDLEPFTKLTQLRRLALDHTSLPVLQHVARVEQLWLHEVRATDLELLARCPDLRELSMSASPLSSLVGLRHVPELRKLSIDSCGPLTTLQALGHVPELETLEVRRCPSLADLAPLADATNLRRLVLEHLGNQPLDLRPLFGLSRLEVVRVVSCRGVPDLLTFEDFDRHRPLRFRRRR